MGRRVNDTLLIRNVEVAGRQCDVRIENGRIAEMGGRLPPRGEEIDGRGGALIPGLIDHHIHLLATAAARSSVSLVDVRGPDELARRLQLPGTGWLRAVGFHEHHGGTLDRAALDHIVPGRPVRVQHQTGSVWFLNSAALAQLDLVDAPPGVDPASGRIERADDWLRGQIGQTPPDLTALGQELASAGVTGVSDASITNDASTAALFASARTSGALPQQVMLMSGGALDPPSDLVMIGPVKILLDDHDLPPLDTVTDRIAGARRWGRRVAVHCVTAGELALALAALAESGTLPGDRIEHGGVIPAESIPVLAELDLTVVTQSAFPWQRGDRYLAEVEVGEQADLYRCDSLKRGGVAVAGSSDGPYATIDPWQAMRAAVQRRTVSGQPIGPHEAVAPREALDLYLGSFADPGGPRRSVTVGASADLCLLHAPMEAALATLSADLVAATVVAGRIVHGDV